MTGDGAALALGPGEDGTVEVCFAFVTQGAERHILPSLLLDDWGNEIAGPALYDWVREQALYFPRAEMFGVDPTGAQVQYFLRDLELLATFPAYAPGEGTGQDAAYIPVHAVIMSNSALEAPRQVDAPDSMSMPMRQARVSWWEVGPRQTSLDFLGR